MLWSLIGIRPLFVSPQKVSDYSCQFLRLLRLNFSISFFSHQVNSNDPFDVFGHALVLNTESGLFQYEDVQKQQITTQDITDLRKVSIPGLIPGLIRLSYCNL